MARNSSRIVETICPYCGCGCRLKYTVRENRVIKAEPLKNDPLSQGKPCIKGLVSYESLDVERIKYPMMRRHKDAPLKKATWAQAYKFIKEKTKNLKGKDIFFTGSGEFSNEDNYLIQKLARIVFKSNNIDCCARLCHVATGKAMHDVYGLAAMPTYMDDVLDSDCILAVGTNPAHNYPVFFNRIIEAKKKGAKLITLHAVPNETSKFSDIHVNVPYEALTAFIAGILNAVSANCKTNAEGFREMKKSISYLTPKYVSKISGIDVRVFNRIVKEISSSKKFTALHGMGLTQHANGTENAVALLNLCVVKGGNSIPMRGKANVQGAGDMGCCPEWLPFGGSKSMLKKLWGIEANLEKGKKITEALENNPVRAVYVMGMNPAQSLPNLNEVHVQLRSMFVIYHHHHPSETMKFADVVLPGAMLIEKDGTSTNAERRVQIIRKTVDPPSKKQDWQIIAELAKVLGYGKHFNYKSAKEVFSEISKAVPEYAGLKWNDLSEKDNCFADKEIRFKRLIPLEKITQVESVRSLDYPFTLTTTRLQYHFCTGEATRRSKTLMKLQPKPICRINDLDAKKLGIKSGDLIRIRSPAGEIDINARIDSELPRKVIVAPYHFESVLLNKVIPSHRHFDLQTMTPNYKAIKVSIDKVLE